jgi:hypothetical protein
MAPAIFPVLLFLKKISMKLFRKVILICVLFYIPFSGKAWGVLGHRIVGQIADSYLTKHTKKEIEKILGFESVAMASNWGDLIKSDPSYKYLYNWHFADIEGGMSHEEFDRYFTADTLVDAYTRLNFMINEMKTNKLLSNDQKKLYLRMIIHVVGDIHQPLHVGRTEDKGGNSIKVKWFDENSNLHQVWDEKLVNFQQLSYTEFAAAINHTTKEQRAAWQAQSIRDMMWDTYTLTEKVYAGVQPDQKLDYSYNFKYVEPLKETLLRGGVHLAGILNDIFK